jgi:hypothetical protein
MGCGQDIMSLLASLTIGIIEQLELICDVEFVSIALGEPKLYQ